MRGFCYLTHEFGNVARTVTANQETENEAKFCVCFFVFFIPVWIVLLRICYSLLLHSDNEDLNLVTSEEN